MSIAYNRVGPGYFEAMGIELMRGREFEETDDAAGPGVIIVNQHFADRFWPGEDALGKQVRVGIVDRTVVGVVVDRAQLEEVAARVEVALEELAQGAHVVVDREGEPRRRGGAKRTLATSALVRPVCEIATTTSPSCSVTADMFCMCGSA